MSTLTRPLRPAIIYPDRDGKPMSDNTLQFRWIVTIEEGFEAIYRDDPKVFVAGDLLWYPVEEKPKIRTAPDVMVVFGRPKETAARTINGRKTDRPPGRLRNPLPGNCGGRDGNQVPILRASRC